MGRIHVRYVRTYIVREGTYRAPSAGLITTDAYLSVFRFGPFQFAFAVFVFYTAGSPSDPTAAGLVAVAGCMAILASVPCFWLRLRNAMVKPLPKA